MRFDELVTATTRPSNADLRPLVHDRKRPSSVYWIDVDLPEPGTPIDSSILQIDPGRILRLEVRAGPPTTSG